MYARIILEKYNSVYNFFKKLLTPNGINKKISTSNGKKMPLTAKRKQKERKMTIGTAC